MGTIKALLPRVAARLAVSAALSALWCLLGGGGVSPNAPLAFCGAVCLAMTWFSYLKGDGFLKFGRYGKYLRSPRAEQADALLKDRTPAEEPPAPKPGGVWVNLCAGLLLIAASFLFPGVRV
jgi:hypothetical protein